MRDMRDLATKNTKATKEGAGGRYAKFKPTGIPPARRSLGEGGWLPQVPEGWEMRKMKYVFTERSEKGHPEEVPLCSTQAHGVIPQSLYENRVVVVNHGFENLKFVQVGDFVISLRSFQGGIEYAYYQGIISAAYTILRLRDADNAAYYRWLFKSHPFVQLLQTCVTGIREGQNINYSVLCRKLIPLPPLPTQREIVAFLDEKCGKVDRLVAAKEKEVALLKELRERVIADAVTGRRVTGNGERGTVGFNAEAQGRRERRGKTKPSGIAWLPEVPEGWEVRRLKNLFTLRNESYSPDEKLQVLSLLKDVGVIPYEEKGNVGNKSKEDFSTYNVARKGDIVMNSMNVIIGSVDISAYDGYISPAYYAITARVGVDANYYNFLFHLRAVQKHMRTLAKGILEIRLRISTTSLFGMAFPFPPLPEQREIVAYIEAKTAKVGAAVAGLEREIAALKEYKQRLIADVVTGQRRVA